MPMMPMEPAKAVRMVRAFLVIRLLSESPSAVKNDMEVFFVFSVCTGSASRAS